MTSKKKDSTSRLSFVTTTCQGAGKERLLPPLSPTTTIARKKEPSLATDVATFGSRCDTKTDGAKKGNK